MSDSKRARVSLDEIQVNAYLGRSRKPKGDRTRRSWSDREEETLVLTLKDLVCNGWKSDNGFRSGYLQKLEEAIKRQCPNSDIKVHPHIVSKLTAWKKSYYLLQGILSRSGVGFNYYGNYKIDCDDDQWSQIVKNDPNTRFMRGKSWPYWEQWQVIFGKDRASGVGAEDVLEMEQEVDTNGSPEGTGIGATPSINVDDISATDPDDGNGTHDPTDGSTCNSSRTRGGGSVGPKKRKDVYGIDGLIELLANMHSATDSRLECLTSRIGYEFDLSKARKQVYELLGSIPGLSRSQKFDAGHIILEKVERLDFFLSIPEDERHAYVLHSLEKYG